MTWGNVAAVDARYDGRWNPIASSSVCSQHHQSENEPCRLDFNKIAINSIHLLASSPADAKQNQDVQSNFTVSIVA